LGVSEVEDESERRVDLPKPIEGHVPDVNAETV
jgi:hypothetical protein